MTNSKKKEASDAPAVTPTETSSKKQKPLSVSSIISNSLMKKIERLSTMIDDSLENGCGTTINGTYETTDMTAINSSAEQEGHDHPQDEVANDKNSLEEEEDTNGNFASWLASQEFDMSAIVWNGDDNNPQDLSSEVGGPVSVPLVPSSPIMGRGCEYSRDEFTDNVGGGGEEKGGNKDNNKEVSPKEVSMDDGYVSISGGTRNRLLWPQIPPAVSDVWDKVASTNWQCWAAATAGVGGVAPNLAAGGDPKKTTGSAKFGYEKQRQGGGMSKSKRQQQQQQLTEQLLKSQNNVTAVKHVTSIEHPAAAMSNITNKPPPPDTITKKKKPPSILRKSSKHKTDKPSTTKDEEDEKNKEDEEKIMKPRNLEDALSQVQSSHVSSSSHANNNKVLRSQPSSSDLSSIATALAGMDFLDDGSTSHYASFAAMTPPRRNDSTTNSCTYSASPIGPAVSTTIVNTNNDAAFPSFAAQSVLHDDVTTVNTNNDAAFPSFAAQLVLHDDDEINQDVGKITEDDDDDTPLIRSSSNSGTETAKTKWSKGRRRRRMRMAK